MRNGLMLAMVLLILCAVSVMIRARSPGPGILRQKAGESEGEARLILLGTFRMYSWLVPLVVVGSLIILPTPGELGRILAYGDGALAIMMALQAHALYWRLGYGTKRWLFAVAHLTGLFALMELYGPLGREATRHAAE